MNYTDKNVSIDKISCKISLIFVRNVRYKNSAILLTRINGRTLAIGLNSPQIITFRIIIHNVLYLA